MAEPNHVVGLPNEDLEAILAEHELRASTLARLHAQPAEGPLDARKFLDDHPEIALRKSIVIDLAYEEYCQRIEAGESVDPDGYCRRFPAFEKSIRRLLDVHAFLEEHGDFLPVVDVTWPEPGRDFEGFEILAELGRGAFARVYLARETALGSRPVAIKVSLDGAGEAQILGKLDHPNIVPVHSVRQTARDGLTIVCEPFLGRVTLFDLIERLHARGTKPTRAQAVREALQAASGPQPAGRAEPLDPMLSRGSFVDAVVHLGAQLAEALAYAHSRNICHGDLKPSNVLVTPAGRPMLLDFNLAFDRESLARRQGGTLPYMAPEQLRAVAGLARGGDATDERSDVFSLGVMLYELIAGRLPFGSIPADRRPRDFQTALLRSQEAGPVDLRQKNPQIDAELAGVIGRCLAFDPPNRFATAGALATALRRSRSPARRARRIARRHVGLIVALAGLLLAAGFGAGAYLAGRLPYPERVFNEGGKAYQRGEYGEADACFTRVLESAPSPELQADARFWRGLTRLRLEEFDLARSDYEQLLDSPLRGKAYAAMAYARGRVREWRSCDMLSEQAIEAGFDAAAVYNNLAFACLRTDMLDRARENLDEAVRRGPTLSVAFQNRAFAEYQRSRRENRPAAPTAADDIEKAMRLAPNAPYVYFDAAAIYERLGGEPGQYRDRIESCLSRALELGANPRLVTNKFPGFVDDPDIQKALRADVTARNRDVTDCLADPFSAEPFPFR